MADFTVVLVHGAFAESASWSGVISPLLEAGHTTVAAANPLRSLSGDAAFVSAVVGSIAGPVVLVGHSYGGAVISNAATAHRNVRALVFVAAFAPLEGESIFELSGRLPGSTLGDTLAPVAVAAVVVRIRRRRPQHSRGDASHDGRAGRVQGNPRAAWRLARVDRLAPWRGRRGYRHRDRGGWLSRTAAAASVS